MLLRNRYRLLERLGAGAMGSVFAALDLRAGSARVALKALWPGDGDGRLVESLREEFRVLAVLNDPRLCRVFDFGRIPSGSAVPGAPEGRPGYFLTRELVEGVDLAAAAAARKRRVADVCGLAAQTARACEVLHRAGLRHGDLKPANVIVDPAGAVHLIDFGLAAAEHAQTTSGTLAYVAPEILGARPVDRRADIYALGITLFEMLTGELPSGRRSGGDLVDWHLGGDAVRLQGFGDGLAAVVRRMCARDADERFPTAGEAAAALEAVVGGAGAARPWSRWCSREWSGAARGRWASSRRRSRGGSDGGAARRWWRSWATPAQGRARSSPSSPGGWSSAASRS